MARCGGVDPHILRCNQFSRLLPEPSGFTTHIFSAQPETAPVIRKQSFLHSFSPSNPSFIIARCKTVRCRRLARPGGIEPPYYGFGDQAISNYLYVLVWLRRLESNQRKIAYETIVNTNSPRLMPIFTAVDVSPRMLQHSTRGGCFRKEVIPMRKWRQVMVTIHRLQIQSLSCCHYTNLLRRLRV